MTGNPGEQQERPSGMWSTSPPPARPGPPTRWSAHQSGPEAALAYRRRFLDLAARGTDLHGEARFVTELAPPPSRVLDAGCGYGRVATELTRLGHQAVGVDADPDLVALAREDTRTRFVVADLSTLDLRTEQEFHVVLLAGNVVPYLADGTLPAVLERLAAHLAPGGHLVAGFGLAGALPEGAAAVDLRDYDRWARAAGLSFIGRWSTWDRAPFSPDSTYALSVHRRLGG
ncbi:class I SAM-dependent methyltransferase [Phycicoccus sonneratiae]|uniref:Class I SAM-dependent methyltransferase n=1 Tax=Phycicoccus sonneratiae TaxID=2807628 RepID=A0ABS2CHJ5_9MICO|nr:class I SAM-dependent methyltransferase [Phycicoccus sonneraticus]MBM6399349.1 class I SAM-dependent methyltransferase [Phycicoccus sonneraticus]